MDNIYIWLALAYAIGTVFGIRLGKQNFSDKMGNIIEATIDRLIKDGYVKSRIDKNGDVELIKYYEE